MTEAAFQKKQAETAVANGNKSASPANWDQRILDREDAISAREAAIDKREAAADVSRTEYGARKSALRGAMSA